MGGIWAEDVEGVGGVEVLPSPDIINHCVWQREGRGKGGRGEGEVAKQVEEGKGEVAKQVEGGKGEVAKQGEGEVAKRVEGGGGRGRRRKV